MRRKPVEVFLSHAHQDSAFLKKLARDLHRHGIPVWFSEHNIEGAQEWMDEIGAALKRCDWLIVILTPAAARSMWVKREVNYVLNKRRYHGRVVPLLLKKCDPTRVAWPLTTIQIVNARPYKGALKALLRIWGIAPIED